MRIEGVILDLDDTLYPELSYVDSGFRAVDRFLSDAGAIEPGRFHAAAKSCFEGGQRSRVFDATLKAMGYTNRYLSGVVLQEAAILAVAGFIPAIALSLVVFKVSADATNLPLELTLDKACHLMAQFQTLQISQTQKNAALLNARCCTPPNC